MLSVRFARNIQRLQHWTQFKNKSTATSIVIGTDGKKIDEKSKSDATAHPSKRIPRECH